MITSERSQHGLRKKYFEITKKASAFTGTAGLAGRSYTTDDIKLGIE